jgi:hypothetical protein
MSKEYTITDQDIEILKAKCEDEVFWNGTIIDEWVAGLKIKQGIIVSKDHCQMVIDTFNTICIDLPQVEKLTEARKSAICARIKEHSLEVVVLVFNITAESNYLNGRIKNWKASFDWVMNPNNFVKILEGNFKNIENVGNNNQPKSNSDHKKSAVDEVAKRFGYGQ